MAFYHSIILSFYHSIILLFYHSSNQAMLPYFYHYLSLLQKIA
nr:hypothetical protein [Helicobacter pylori]